MSVIQRYRAVVAYDGTDFFGYQFQLNRRTVQGDIEKALNSVTQSDIRVKAAGRTDAGVHATGQVITFDTRWKHSLPDLHRALNATLPADIVISNLQITDSTFHPRFDAISRTYRYQIVNQAWPTVLHRHYAWHVKQPLDMGAMQTAAQLLVGMHDFASFGKPPQGNNTVRTISGINWRAAEPFLFFEITANAFLYRMVRRIVGTLVQTGVGQIAPNHIETILKAQDLTRSAPPAPAHGLCLVGVTYPDE